MFEKQIQRWKNKLRKYADRYLFRPDMENDPEFQKVYRAAKKFTMTSMEKCYALHQAVQYITDHQIPGDIVECGVWKGGSSMLAALTLKTRNDTHRKIYMYDTYEGMSPPTEKDIDIHGRPYREIFERERDILTVSLETVRENMFSTGYPCENIIFIKGKVEDTIPDTVPDAVSLLRMDTDFYESTRHELKHLYPLLSPLGVFIIDDYGHFQGAREATDQYFSENGHQVMLNRIDYSCRVGIKPLTRI